MSFGANSIGFFMDIDASPMRRSFQQAERTYDTFIKRLDRANNRAVAKTQGVLDKLAEAAKAFADLPGQAVRQYDAAIDAIHKRVRPIKQPVDLVFGQKGLGGLQEAVGKAVNDALSNVRLTPVRPTKKSSIFNQRGSVADQMRKQPQQPDHVFKTTHGMGRPKKYAGGAYSVTRSPGSLPGNDQQLAALTEGEMVLSRDASSVFRRMVLDFSGLSRLDKKLEAAMSKMESMGSFQALGATLVGARRMERFGTLREMGVNVDPTLVRATNQNMLKAHEAFRGDVTKAYQSGLLNAEELEKIASTLKEIEASVERVQEVDTKKPRGILSADYWKKLGKNVTSPVGYLALSQAIRDLRGAGGAALGVLGSTPSTQEGFARVMAHVGGSMQFGRTAFSDVFNITGSAAQSEQIAATLYGLQRQGFRGSSLRGKFAAGIAMAAQGGGADAGILASQAGAFRRAGMGESASTVALANQLAIANKQGLSLGDVTGVLSQSSFGRSLSTIARTRNLNDTQTRRVVEGISGLTAAVYRGGGGDEFAGQVSAGMADLLSSAARGDQGAMQQLSLAYGVDMGSFERTMRTGDFSGMVGSMKGRASEIRSMSAPALTQFAQAVGMTTDELRLWADAMSEVDPAKVAGDFKDAGKAFRHLRKRALAASNIADQIRAQADRLGANANTLSQGAAASAMEMPWERLGALGYLGSAVLGGLGVVGARGGVGSAVWNGLRGGVGRAWGMGGAAINAIRGVPGITGGRAGAYLSSRLAPHAARLSGAVGGAIGNAGRYMGAGMLSARLATAGWGAKAAALGGGALKWGGRALGPAAALMTASDAYNLPDYYDSGLYRTAYGASGALGMAGGIGMIGTGLAAGLHHGMVDPAMRNLHSSSGKHVDVLSRLASGESTIRAGAGGRFFMNMANLDFDTSSNVASINLSAAKSAAERLAVEAEKEGQSELAEFRRLQSDLLGRVDSDSSEANDRVRDIAKARSMGELMAAARQIDLLESINDNISKIANGGTQRSFSAANVMGVPNG